MNSILALIMAATAEQGPRAPSIGGSLLDLGGSVPAGLGLNQTQATPVKDGLRVVFKAGSQYPNIAFPIPPGGWDLSTFGGVGLEVTNPGPESVRAYLRVDNVGAHETSPWNTHSVQVDPGKTAPLRGLFGHDNDAAGFPLDTSHISGIQVFLINPPRDTTLVLTGLKAWGSPADRAVAEALTHPEDRGRSVTPPEWLGRRPPVDGDWVPTLDENFDGNSLDSKRWTTRFPWTGPMPGQLQRYSPENVIVEKGLARFKSEKRQGHENNDTSLGARDFTSGLIQSYDKWTQAYGYFEARIRLPKARGLWPAFWMMPDRGGASGLESWQRRSTDSPGMEIDILEHLCEWGPGRMNVAVHWDGYDANHKSWGSSHVYFGPTPDGFHAFGLLWEPGKLTWFVDGRKVAEWSNEKVPSVPCYLKLNVQMGGWATKDVDLTSLPDFMEADYVRAWQLKSRLEKR